MSDEKDITDLKTNVAATQAAGSTPDKGHHVDVTGALVDRYIGTKVGGRYQIEKELGRGGIGVVYLARDQQLLSKHVVIKVLLDDAGADEWVRNKFRHEIEALTRIDHPGVIGALDTGQMPDGKPYFVMQFVEGVNLRSVMKPEGMDLSRVANIVKQLGSALSAAHDKGVFHRDLKPENVMLQISDREERVKLIDFGIAKVHNAIDGQSTQVPMIAGTFNYMAPEQLTGEPVTAASDTYAFAIMAYEMITGRRPFSLEANSASAMLINLIEQQRNGPRLKPKDLRPTISDEAQEVILRAFAYEPIERQARAQEFGDELSAALLASPKPSAARAAQSLTNSQPNAGGGNTNINVAVKTSANQNSQSPDTAAAALPQSARDTSAIAAASEKKGNSTMIIAIVAVVLALGLGALLLPRLLGKNEPAPGASPAPASAASPVAAGPARSLVYWLMVQKYRDGKPYKDPFRLSHEINFEEGDQVKLFFSGAQTGNLYILNEGPPSTDGKPSYWNTLFPSPKVNNGSSALSANGEIQLPAFQFDNQSGTEKLWLVWSENKIDELEALQKWYNPQDKGEIKDLAQIDAAKKIIEANSKPPAQIERDDDNKKQTTIKGNGKTVVSVLKLEHH